MRVGRGQKDTRITTFYRCEHHKADSKVVFYTKSSTEERARMEIRARALNKVGEPPKAMYRRHLMQKCSIKAGDRERIEFEKFFDIEGSEVTPAAAK